MLTSISMALLDPKVLRMLIEVWVTQDMHQHVATEFMTGEGVGPWGYAVNDYGILRCADSTCASPAILPGSIRWSTASR
jgi:hypothetical protein